MAGRLAVDFGTSNTVVAVWDAERGGGRPWHVGEDGSGLAVPVEWCEHYEAWLLGVAEGAGMPCFRVIDEASAAALGYGTMIQPDDVYLVFDFGGGTLDVSVVLIGEDASQPSGRR